MPARPSNSSRLMSRQHYFWAWHFSNWNVTERLVGIFVQLRWDAGIYSRRVFILLRREKDAIFGPFGTPPLKREGGEPSRDLKRRVKLTKPTSLLQEHADPKVYGYELQSLLQKCLRKQLAKEEYQREEEENFLRK